MGFGATRGGPGWVSPRSHGRGAMLTTAERAAWIMFDDWRARVESHPECTHRLHGESAMRSLRERHGLRGQIHGMVRGWISQWVSELPASDDPQMDMLLQELP